MRGPHAAIQHWMTMTTDTSGPQGPEPGNPPPSRESTARRVFADTKAGASEAMRASAPVLKNVAARLGDWLATVGWGKFFLVAILMWAVAGIATGIFSS